jgi:hypothetical protein
LLWDDARIAKEMLSRAASATLHVPVVGTDLLVPREAFEQRARPLLDQTVRTTSAVLRWSTMDKAKLAGVFLVGGSSRVPLVATLLHRELGIPPTVIEQPEMVVAEGSMRAGPGQVGAVPAPPGRPVSAAPASPAPVAPVSPVSPAQANPAPVSGSPAGAVPVSPAAPLGHHASYHASPVPPPSQMPTRVAAAQPVWPAASYPPPARPALPPQQLAPAQAPAQRRRVAVPVLATLLVLAMLGIAFVVLRPRLVNHNQGGGGRGNGNGSGASSQASGGQSAKKAFQRAAERPTWVARDWVALNRVPASDLWVNRVEPEGGECDARRALRVTRPNSGLTGCSLKNPMDQRIFTDVAVEALVSVNAGCAGIWARTGNKGYLLAVCHGRVELYRLGNDPPSPSNSLGRWSIAGPRSQAVVGLLASGTTLRAYFDGALLGSVTDDQIGFGKVNAGAITGEEETADVVIEDFWVFAPAGAAAPASSAGSPSPSASASKKPSASPLPTP